jgi:pyrroloquinoline quinone biosynthesis protein B
VKAVVLGAAAGGGFPQWNCRCVVCEAAWAHDERAPWRTQSGLAVTGDGEHWLLLNASPDLGSQIRATPSLWPRGRRHSPIAAVVLTSGEIDHIAGLLTLREHEGFDLVALAPVHAAIAANPVFNAVPARRLAAQPEGSIALAGLTVTLFPVAGKVPLYREGEAETLQSDDGETAGVRVTDGQRSLVYVPGCAASSPDLRRILEDADVVFFDGTLFTDDEMIRAEVGAKTGRRMGHMPIAGPDGSLIWLEGLPGRTIYVHLNNTNPALIAGSPERRRIDEAGIDVAHDGMEVVL